MLLLSKTLLQILAEHSLDNTVDQKLRETPYKFKFWGVSIITNARDLSAQEKAIELLETEPLEYILTPNSPNRRYLKTKDTQENFSLEICNDKLLFTVYTINCSKSKPFVELTKLVLASINHETWDGIRGSIDNCVYSNNVRTRWSRPTWA